jgi:uncharacterized iron-regulated membrane protein
VNTLRLVHRVVGLVLAIPVIAVSLSGGLLLLRDPYYRARYPVLAQPFGAGEQAGQAEILTRIETAFAPAGVRVVKFPRPGVNGFHVYLTDGSEAFVDPRSGAVIARWRWSTSLPAFLFDLHAHLLMGATGETMNGYAALALVFLGLTGLVIWVPRRAAFSIRRPLPRRWTSGELLRSHGASGAILAGPILFFAATGAALVFYEPLWGTMSAALDRRPPVEPTAFVARAEAPRRPWSEILAAARTALPEAGPAMYYPGSGPNAVLTFRKSLPGEWHPNGRSYVLIDPYTARVAQAIDARAQGAGTRAMHAVYPLHAARVGGVGMIVMAAAAAAGLVWLALGGAWAWLGRSAATRRVRKTVPDRLRRYDHATVAPALVVAGNDLGGGDPDAARIGERHY